MQRMCVIFASKSFCFFFFGIIRARICAVWQSRNIIGEQTVGIYSYGCNVINNRSILSTCDIATTCEVAMLPTRDLGLDFY